MRNEVKTFKPDEVENRFNHAIFIAQQLGIYSQRHWTNSINKVEFNQLVDDAAEKFEIVKAVNLQTLQNKHKYKHNFNNYKVNEPITLTKFF